MSEIAGLPGWLEPTQAALDSRRANALRPGDDISAHLDPPVQGVESRLRLYVRDRPVTLSAVVPLLERLGLEVLDERSQTLAAGEGATVWMHDIGVRHSSPSR